MRFHRGLTCAVACSLGLLFATTAHADTFGSRPNEFAIDFVEISGATNPSSGHGVVEQDYRMGIYEITNGQWDKFEAQYGSVTGSPAGAYDADATTWTGTNEPTNQVSWYEASQFVNWLNTSTGHQAAYKFTGTKNTGSYTLDTWSPAEADNATNLYRHKDAFYYLPTEDEWVKAAYWNGTERQTYATKPGETLEQGNGRSGTGWNYDAGPYAADPPPPGPWDVGSGSEELNGTYDMMGNVSEWLETSEFREFDYGADTNRLLRGGSFLSLYGTNLNYDENANVTNTYPANEDTFIGFRVASEVPEPGTASLLALGSAGLLIRRRR